MSSTWPCVYSLVLPGRRFTLARSSGGKSGEGAGNAQVRSMPSIQRESGGFPPNAGTIKRASANPKTKVLIELLPIYFSGPVGGGPLEGDPDHEVPGTRL